MKIEVNTSISTLLEFEMFVLPASPWDAQKTSVLWTSHRLFRWTKRKALMPPRQPPAQFSSLQQSNLDLYNPPPLVPCNVRIEVVSSREAKVHSNFLFSNESQIKFVSMYIPLNVCIPNLLPHPNSLQNITNLYEDGNVIYFPIHSF